VPLDGSAFAEEALAAAIDVLGPEASDYMQAVMRRVEQDHPGTRVRIDVRAGKPAEGIATAAAVNLADLIVMSTHGRTGLRRAVLGSVAGAALRTSHTPVLLVHPHPESPPTIDEEDVATVTALVSF
jgi:nucleotide-binding universal stress UspA family protein